MAKVKINRLRRLVAVDEQAGHKLVATAPTASLKELFKRFWPYARPYRGWLLLSLLLAAAIPAVETATIWMWKLLVDDVLVPRNFGAFPAIAGTYIGLTLLAGAFAFTDQYLSTWVGEQFILRIRTAVFAHLQALSLDFFARRRLGDLVSRLTGDVAQIEQLALSGVTDALSYGLRAVFFAGALFVIQWQLAVVALTVTPLFWATARWFSRLRRRASREKRRRTGSIATVAEEAISKIALVQACNRQATEVARFHREGVGSMRAQMASARLKALFSPIVDLIELAGALVVLGVGVWLLSTGALSLGGLMAFLAYLMQLYSPIRGLGRLSNTMFSAAASSERIIELLDERPLVVDSPQARRVGSARGAVAFEKVGFTYPGASTAAVANLSLTVEPGETVALVGASGAGKSTLAKLLLRFFDPDTGVVSLDGYDLRAIRIEDLRANIAVLLQENLIFHGTVSENISYGRAGATEAEIVAAARAADSDGFIRSLPDGYATVVGENGARLSGGQRQRIAIARAFVRDAPILLLDEPTGSLDGESSRRVLDPLRRLMDGRTVIVISHNLRTARDADSVVVLDGGTVAEIGDHSSLLAYNGRYARLWRLHTAQGAELTSGVMRAPDRAVTQARADT